MKTCKVVIEDEVNIKMEGLDVETRRKCSNSVKFFLPHARYSAAYKLGRWDGTQSYCTIGGRSYLNLLDKFLPIIQENGYDLEIVDNRKTYNFDFDVIDKDVLSDRKWPEGHRLAGESIELRDYQVDIVNNCLKNTQGINIAATSAGKTIATVALSSKVEKYGRSIIIVPNTNLVQQTEEDYKNVGLDVGVLYGSRKEYDRTHTICTWQSLSILDKKSKDHLDDDQMEVFMKGLICVIVDECHAVKHLNVLQSMLTTTFADVPLRWGLTGTLPDEEYQKISLVSSIGPVIGELSAYDLQQQGHIAKCDITLYQTQESIKFNNYQSELKYLVTNDSRIDWMTNLIKKTAESGNTVVLVDRIPTGEMIQSQIPDSVFISGSMKASKRREHYKDINVEENKILIATYGVLSTGVSINRIFNLILVEPGKSSTRVIQSIGRGLRKADDKDEVRIIDISSVCRFSKKHMNVRRELYKKAKYPFNLIKVNYSEDK